MDVRRHGDGHLPSRSATGSAADAIAFGTLGREFRATMDGDYHGNVSFGRGHRRPPFRMDRRPNRPCEGDDLEYPLLLVVHRSVLFCAQPVGIGNIPLYRGARNGWRMGARSRPRDGNLAGIETAVDGRVDRSRSESRLRTHRRGSDRYSHYSGVLALGHDRGSKSGIALVRRATLRARIEEMAGL